MIRKQRGFTLLEVLIGLIFLAIGLLAVAGLQITSVRGNFFSNNLMQATYVAQDRLEYLINSPSTYNQKDGDYNEGPVTISGIVFNRSYKLTTNGNLKTISYTVTWNDGTNHRISFSTIRSQ